MTNKNHGLDEMESECLRSIREYGFALSTKKIMTLTNKRRNGKRPYSFYAVQNSLKEMQNLGIIGFRDTKKEKRKANGLWYYIIFNQEGENERE